VPGVCSDRDLGRAAADDHASTIPDVSNVTRAGSRSPLAYIESLLAPDGSVRYSRTSAQTPVWVTAQALIALAGKPFPIAPAPSRPIARHASAPSVRARPRVAASAHAAHPARVPIARARRSQPKTKAKGLTSAASLPASAQVRLEAIARTAGMLVGLVLAPVLR
jgi:hypothetical protein